MNPNELSHRYLWGPAVDMLLADEQTTGYTQPGETLWALADHLGTVRDFVSYDTTANDTVLRKHTTYDAYGRVTAEQHYDANENPISPTDADAKDVLFGFTGRALDDATGLQNNLNRWLDPDAGEWLSEDPIGFEAQDANLGRYVGNAAPSSVDPTGLDDLAPGESPGLSEFLGILAGDVDRDGDVDNDDFLLWQATSGPYVSDLEEARQFALSVKAPERPCVVDVREVGFGTPSNAFGLGPGSWSQGFADVLIPWPSPSHELIFSDGSRRLVLDGNFTTGELAEIMSAGLGVSKLNKLRGAPKRVPTGQVHHPVSTKVGRELSNNPNLRGKYTLRDPRFTTRAIDGPAHRGYQRWHRQLDDEVAGWLRRNRNATPEQFESYLRQLYQCPDLKARFPEGF